MNPDIVDKIRSERKFFLLRKEALMEQVESKKMEVLEMEYKLETLRKDLARSDSILDLLRENGF